MTDICKTRVLFVDDEPRVLDGIKRMLRSQRDSWEMAFAGSGVEALQLVEDQNFHVVVSDMRMPGMDGVELLSKIKHRYPQTVRLILSGHAETSSVMRALCVSHQYLSKPCNPDLLIAAIQRAFNLNEIFANERVKALVSRVDSLPSLPETYQELVTCLSDPDNSMQLVAKIIGKDVSMSAKLIRLVNSAYFGLRQPATNIERAVSLLGVETVSSLVLVHGIFDQASPQGVHTNDITRLWRHSLNTAAIARGIARAEGLDRAQVDEVFLSGMVHDIGQLVLVTQMPEDYARIQGHLEESSVTTLAAEELVLGTSHPAIGAYLLALWGLPNPIVEAVMHHEEPGESSAPELDNALIVHAADQLANEPLSTGSQDTTERVAVERVDTLNCSERWTEWQSIAQNILTGVGKD